MSRLFNLARMHTATLGSAALINLGAAVTGFLTFEDAGATDGLTVSYAINDPAGGGSEIGSGVYHALGPSFTRTTVEKSSLGTSRIPLSVNAEIMITPSAATLNKIYGLAEASTDNAIVRFDGTTGGTQDSGITVSDTNVLSGGTFDAEMIGESIQAETEDTAPDLYSDYVPTYDASADTGKKVAMSRLTALTNVRLAKTASYTAANTDRGKVIALGGSAFYPLTFDAASGYDATYAVTVVNEDTGRGKTIALNGLSSFILWPGQAIVVFNDNSTWKTIGRSRWKLPSGSLSAYCDFTNGNDTNDGLATGSGNAFKTVNGAIHRLLNDWDWDGTESGQSTVVLNMAASTTDTGGIHFAPQSFVGAQGGANFTVKGGSGSIISVSGSDGVNILFGAVVKLQDLTIRSNINGLTVQWGGKVYLSGVTFGGGGVTPAGGHISVASGGQIEQAGSITFAGDAAYGIVNNGGYFRTVANAIGFSADAAFTSFLLASEPSLTSFAGTTISLNAHTVTGKRFDIAKCASVISGAGDGLVTYLPGNAVGTIATGAIYDAKNGTPTNDNAAAGAIGEDVTSDVESASAVALTTVTAANVTSISLTAGDWEVTGIVHLAGNAVTTVANGYASVSTTSVTLSNTAQNATQFWGNGATIFAAANYVSIPRITRRVTIASTTTIYLVTTVSFAVNTASAFGSLRARRVR